VSTLKPSAVQSFEILKHLKSEYFKTKRGSILLNPKNLKSVYFKTKRVSILRNPKTFKK